MVDLTKAIKIGVIVEDQSDFDIIDQLTRKIIKNNRFSFRVFKGRGSGAVRRKCAAWAKNFLNLGYSHLVILHDLDDFKEKELRNLFETKVKEFNFEQTVVLIPVREIEAWLLCDAKALQTVFKMQTLPRTPTQPEEVLDPKEFLADAVYKSGKNRYINTIHNKYIAKEISLPELARCPSFSPYPSFLKTVFPDGASWV